MIRLQKGKISNPFHKSQLEIGFIGVGEYTKVQNRKRYETWSGMLERCYNPKYHAKEKSYKDCTVCEEWHNFQNFAKWYDENYYEVKGEQMDLDKDILVKGNKVYSPETCIFVPKLINSFTNKRQNLRGDLPMGVTCKSDNNKKYIARCGNPISEKREYLGVFENPNDAFYAYKLRKENNAKILADYYKDKIPQKLHETLYSYCVSIDD